LAGLAARWLGHMPPAFWARVDEGFAPTPRVCYDAPGRGERGACRLLDHMPVRTVEPSRSSVSPGPLCSGLRPGPPSLPSDFGIDLAQFAPAPGPLCKKLFGIGRASPPIWRVPFGAAHCCSGSYEFGWAPFLEEGNAHPPAFTLTRRTTVRRALFDTRFPHELISSPRLRWKDVLLKPAALVMGAPAATRLPSGSASAFERPVPVGYEGRSRPSAPAGPRVSENAECHSPARSEISPERFRCVVSGRGELAGEHGPLSKPASWANFGRSPSGTGHVAGSARRCSRDCVP